MMSIPDEQLYPGERLGLPETGPSSVAPWGRRSGAFLLDVVISAALTVPFTLPNAPKNWALVTFAVLYIGTSAFLGRTPGMMATHLRLASDRPGRRLGLIRAVVRTVLLMVLIPAIISNSDRRGLHDRCSGTTVVTD